MFPVGSPDLSREGQEELRIFGQQLERILASLDDEDFMIRVDGHADIKPYLFSPYGNWDLSSQRAVSVVEFLIENTDIPADRLMVAAFGSISRWSRVKTRTPSVRTAASSSSWSAARDQDQG